MIELYGRKRVTRDDIPAILNGKIPYERDEYGEFYFLPLSNGRFESVSVTHYEASRGQDLEYVKNREEERVKHSPNYGRFSLKHAIEFLKFHLPDKEWATCMLIADEIVSKLEKLPQYKDKDVSWNTAGGVFVYYYGDDGKYHTIGGGDLDDLKRLLSKVNDECDTMNDDMENVISETVRRVLHELIR